MFLNLHDGMQEHVGGSEPTLQILGAPSFAGITRGTIYPARVAPMWNPHTCGGLHLSAVWLSNRH